MSKTNKESNFENENNREEFPTPIYPVDRFTSVTPLIKVDRHLRREENFGAKVCRRLCSAKGEEYLNSRWKRFLDLSVGVPAAILATPAIIGFGIATKVDDHGSIFFVHDRLDTDLTSSLGIVKIRCMKEGSHLDPKTHELARNFDPEDDPRNNRVGAFMRKYQIEELPQLFQAINGNLSMVGVRAITPDLIDVLREHWSEERIQRWLEVYGKGKTGITGLTQSMSKNTKQNEDRFHYDAFYVENASLGLDLFIIWRTLLRLMRKDTSH